MLGIMVFGLARLSIDTTTDSVLDTQSPDWAFYQSSQELFGGDEIVVVALPGDRAFDRSLLSRVEDLNRALERIPGVRRVDSLASVPVIRLNAEGDLELTPALDGDASSTEIRRLVSGDRIAPRALVSEDGRVAALNVLIDQDHSDYDAVVEQVRAALGETEGWVSGVPVFRSAASARTGREILLFVPLTVVAIGLLISIGYGSARMTGVAMAVGLAGSWVMVGLMGFTGTPLSLVTMILPSVMLALGCAYVMHVLSAARGDGHADGMAARLKEVALPVLLSSLTTAIGFSAIGTVGIDEVRFVGGFGAVGALVLGVAALTLAPAILVLSPPPERSRSREVEGRTSALLFRIAQKHRWSVLAIWVLLLGGVSAGIQRLDVVTDATQWFPKGNEVRDSYDSIGARLSGISPVNVVMESVDGEAVTLPEPLAALDGLTEHLASLEQVGKALSVRDPLRQIHGAFAGDPSMPLPIGANLAEQYLLLLESVDQIGDLVTDDRMFANITLRVNDNGSEALLDVARQAEAWWAANGVDGFEIRATGIMYEFARAEDAIALGQLKGLLLALVAIGTTMLLALRNVRLALISMVPNVVPTAMAFGLMGWAGIPLDAGTVVVGSLALGVAVDDTIHLVSAFHERRTAGARVEDALRRALGTVLHPVVLTTAAIAIGFGLLGFSGFTLTRNLGLVLAGVTVVCLLADLVLLPALLFLAEGRREDPTGS
ncbi:MAG: efflux RND transporter permease subunit [Myxococcota bacterium]